MIKVITYGSFDMLHYGHIRLLERAKALGDYLVVGVTSDDYDKVRGKINLQQSLMERVESVKATGIPDEVIIEEYEGQKIDDIKRLGIDIFTVGSDWAGYFDYLREYCQVVYLDRTQGISSSEIRSKKRSIKIGLVGEEEGRILNKYFDEANVVNGIHVSGICTINKKLREEIGERLSFVTDDYYALLDKSDAVYIISHPREHYNQIKAALLKGKHVLVETPITLHESQCAELFQIAGQNKLILMEALKTAYATAYNRLLLLIKSKKIGKVVSVDATCTSLREINPQNAGYNQIWNSICAWGPTALLPIFQILGTEYTEAVIHTYYYDKRNKFDAFTKIDFTYKNAVASIKVGRGVKSEGELIITGTRGYIYVPAPWWKTDYFEIRYENSEENKRYFYQLEGEGIRYELVAFSKTIDSGKNLAYIKENESLAICQIMNQYFEGKNIEII